jgi:hypothetical protein
MGMENDNIKKDAMEKLPEVLKIKEIRESISNLSNMNLESEDLIVLTKINVELTDLMGKIQAKNYYS